MMGATEQQPKNYYAGFNYVSILSILHLFKSTSFSQGIPKQI